MQVEARRKKRRTDASAPDPMVRVSVLVHDFSTLAYRVGIEVRKLETGGER